MPLYKIWDPNDTDEAGARTLEAPTSVEAGEDFAAREFFKEPFKTMTVHVRDIESGRLIAVHVSALPTTTFEGRAVAVDEPQAEAR